MARKRYKEQGTGSFFGEYLYDKAVPESHFLRKKCFLKLAVDEAAPDHSTATSFERRIVHRAGEGFLEEELAARRQGVAFGSIQVVDSTHTVADVNVAKEKHRRDGVGNRHAMEGESRSGARPLLVLSPRLIGGAWVGAQRADRPTHSEGALGLPTRALPAGPLLRPGPPCRTLR